MKVGLHPDAESLYVEEIDLGEGQPRQVWNVGMLSIAVLLATELHAIKEPDAASRLSPMACFKKT